MRDVLDYFPIAGTVLLTGGIAWIGVSTWIGNRRKIGDALRGRHYHSGGILVPDDELPTILDRPGEYRIFPGHPLYDHFRNSRRTLPNSRPVASGPASSLPNGAGPPLFSMNAYLAPPELVSEGSGVIDRDACRHGADLPTRERGRIDAAGNVTWKVGLSLSGGVVSIRRAELQKALDAGWILASHPSDEDGFVIVSRKPQSSEVTSEITPYPHDCTCHPDDRPPVCQHRYAASDCQAAYGINTRLAPADWREEVLAEHFGETPPITRAELLDAVEDEGEPLPTPAQPNMGGIGNPPYHGPHYDSVLAEESRYVPYDVLRDLPEDAAVHFAGDGDAVAGPLAVEHEGKEHGANSRRDENEA